MSNQQAGLSQMLAEQRITEWQERATQARLARAGRPPQRWRRSWVARGRWWLARRPGGGTDQPVDRPTTPQEASCAH